LIGAGAGVLVVVVVIVGAVIALSGGGGGGSASSGFNNPVTLANDVQRAANQHLNDPSSGVYNPGASVSGVTCIHTSGTNFECNGTGSDGSTNSVSVTVAADGKSWISH
jgi:hypothetical protein